METIGTPLMWTVFTVLVLVAQPLLVVQAIHVTVARHVLLLQEEHRMAFAFGKQRDQHVGAGHFLAA